MESFPPGVLPPSSPLFPPGVLPVLPVVPPVVPVLPPVVPPGVVPPSPTLETFGTSTIAAFWVVTPADWRSCDIADSQTARARTRTPTRLTSSLALSAVKSVIVLTSCCARAKVISLWMPSIIRLAARLLTAIQTVYCASLAIFVFVCIVSAQCAIKQRTMCIIYDV